MTLLAGLQNTMNLGVQQAQQRFAAAGGGNAPAPAPAAGAQGAPAAQAAQGPQAAQGASDQQKLPDSAAGQAGAGAAAVQPPNTQKIIFGSVLRGAVTGASMM